jgi:Ca-activated chloride channel family protein
MKRHILNLAVAIVALFAVAPAISSAQKPPATVAMVFLVDVSGSMSQGQLTIAKEAAKASLKALRDSDRFGTLAFNTASTWIAPLQTAGNRDAINAQIETMSAGGGTNIYVGLNGAYDALKDAKEDVKVVIVLSDGLTQSGDFQSLATSMSNARISISAITVGLQGNRSLMADLALWGKGRAYYTQSYDRVPQILIKETELAVGKTQ